MFSVVASSEYFTNILRSTCLILIYRKHYLLHALVFTDKIIFLPFYCISTTIFPFKSIVPNFHAAVTSLKYSSLSQRVLLCMDCSRVSKVGNVISSIYLFIYLFFLTNAMTEKYEYCTNILRLDYFINVLSNCTTYSLI